MNFKTFVSIQRDNFTYLFLRRKLLVWRLYFVTPGDRVKGLNLGYTFRSGNGYLMTAGAKDVIVSRLRFRVTMSNYASDMSWRTNLDMHTKIIGI
jgi:hypothetical protein